MKGRNHSITANKSLVHGAMIGLTMGISSDALNPDLFTESNYVPETIKALIAVQSLNFPNEIGGKTHIWKLNKNGVTEID